MILTACSGSPGGALPGQSAECGDSAIENGDACDDGSSAPDDGCDDACQVESACGNGTVESAEACDDGNRAPGDGCSDTCQAEPACGNGTVESAEACDDGNRAPGDGCDDACQVETPSEWTCSPTYFGAGDGCDCGCGMVDPDCADTTVGSCEYCVEIGSCSEGSSCPGNIAPANNATCVPPVGAVCGNDAVESGESCDDGNTAPGDGCSVNCQTESPAGWSCNPTYFGAGDGCDCGCGILDPDCTAETVSSCDWCNDVGSCSTAADSCPGNIDPVDNSTCLAPPLGWTCDPAYFGAGDGCDCGCGALDPDCADPTVGSCEYCDQAGSCALGSPNCDNAPLRDEQNYLCE